MKDIVDGVVPKVYSTARNLLMSTAAAPGSCVWSSRDCAPWKQFHDTLSFKPFFKTIMHES